jgi:hypothetical protein
MIHLPRQARDKHRESTQKGTVYLQPNRPEHEEDYNKLLIDGQSSHAIHNNQHLEFNFDAFSFLKNICLKR